MNSSMISAMVSMQALQQKLNIQSHNVANLNTTGYKKLDTSFQDLLTTRVNQVDDFQLEGRKTSLGVQEGVGIRVSNPILMMEQGVLTETNLSTDLAIDGDGFFEVGTLDGNERLFTRNGSFQLVPSFDNPEVMHLATSSGQLVKTLDNEPVSIPVNHDFTIDETGRIFAYNNLNPGEEPLELGQLKVVRILSPQYMQSAGNSLYTLPEDILEDPTLVYQIDQDGNLTKDPEDKTNIRVLQGFLEQSNVNLSEEMTEMMMTQRAFQLTSKAYSNAETMMKLAANLRS
ncbi:flagellar hook-basal body protein [Chengkuizengella axinellae]|uniref:Flagellar hook-basal body protein n=1 Tax=Chengkuizengella axinellae TaxID=3064388 RepID=A0ABT9IZA1_9BACL|nr:flagellar hook-basal body protein [Chengkuizengella sp. 2205SS18-9]MDP5274640.1 flagellar hook-basal body protein [Chengkuizengella sp. 2205SS18-9]